MNQSDPTDHALAAIASILDRPAENLAPKVEDKADAWADVEPPPEPAAQAEEETAAQPEVLPLPSPVPVPEPTSETDIDRYEKLGPGPLDAIRFRWTARRDDFGNYYVDETIGPHSRPLSTGPMPKNQVIGFIDERAREAEQRFNTFKTEMTAAHVPGYPRDDGGEA